MSLYRRKGSPSWQYDFTVNGIRFRGSTGEAGKREATKVADDIKQSARRRAKPSREWTMQMLCETYWADHAKDLPSAPTILGQPHGSCRGLGRLLNS